MVQILEIRVLASDSPGESYGSWQEIWGEGIFLYTFEIPQNRGIQSNASCVRVYVRALKGERSSENLRETGDDFSMSKEKASKKMREKRRGDVGETLSTTWHEFVISSGGSFFVYHCMKEKCAHELRNFAVTRFVCLWNFGMFLRKGREVIMESSWNLYLEIRGKFNIQDLREREREKEGKERENWIAIMATNVIIMNILLYLFVFDHSKLISNDYYLRMIFIREIV